MEILLILENILDYCKLMSIPLSLKFYYGQIKVIYNEEEFLSVLQVRKKTNNTDLLQLFQRNFEQMFFGNPKMYHYQAFSYFMVFHLDNVQ